MDENNPYNVHEDGEENLEVISTSAALTTNSSNPSRSSTDMPNTFSIASTMSSYIEDTNEVTESVHRPSKPVPSATYSKLSSSKIQLQPRSAAAVPRILSNLPSPLSLNIPHNQPQSLFLQALSKLNESAISIAVNNMNPSLLNEICVKTNQFSSSIRSKTPELSTPDSLASAPPSYSFVLRQMAARRRPRIVGTFIPSPSFVQPIPPPNYAAAFDVYLDSLPPPPTRVYNFGFTPIPVVCPDCGYTGMTAVTSKITLCTHLCAIVLCMLCCWICAPLPYILKSCKDVYHYCRNCRNFLGMYCPTNPDNTLR